jgi:hypothetical protein
LLRRKQQKLLQLLRKHRKKLLIGRRWLRQLRKRLLKRWLMLKLLKRNVRQSSTLRGKLLKPNMMQLLKFKLRTTKKAQLAAEKAHKAAEEERKAKEAE